MYILGIAGSPKKDGITEGLLDAVLKGAKSRGCVTEKIFLNDLRIKPCQACGGCERTGVCVIRDDMRVIYKKMARADGIVIASPVYFGSVTAQLKAMIDRFQCVWISRYILSKRHEYTVKPKGVFISAAGENRVKHFKNAKEVVNTFFCTIGAQYSSELFFGGCNSRDNIEDLRKSIFKKAFSIGKQFKKSVSK